MKKIGFTLLILLAAVYSAAQSPNEDQIQNSSQKMLSQPEKLTIGGYGQFDYNQPLASNEYRNGVLDIHRMVLLFAYKFDDRTSFVTEIELEHVKEVYVEQAFVNYRITPWLQLRGGLMLVPMGIINEYHEPTTFNGVERPNLDKYIVPTTWRELGLGFQGQFLASGLSYQLYLFNGFLGSDEGEARLGGSSLFRSGRQKGAESVFTRPNISARINYTGIPGLTAGISSYFGQSQSTFFDGIDRSNTAMLATADSTLVGIRMFGVDIRYSRSGIGVRSQLNAGSITNADAYNAYHGSDLGSSFLGYYAEISYDVLHSVETGTNQLIPFARYEKYDTHRSVDAAVTKNDAFNRTDITFGIGWKPNPGLIYKIDYQLFSNASTTPGKQQFNAGIGVWF